MTIQSRLSERSAILMEGALGERLKREYGLAFDPHLALAVLVYTEEGRNALAELWAQYIAIAGKHGLPFLATTPTRRANRERVAGAGLDEGVILDNARFLLGIKASSGIEMYAGGLMGCRGDAYTGEDALSEREAHAFHAWQANCFKRAGVDFLYAAIMPTLPETQGMAAAMSDTELPYIISFTIQKSGRLIDGTSIHDAIVSIDARAARQPLCYMTNCVYPAIAHEALSQPCNKTDTVKNRFKGIQGNASPLPYAELDDSNVLQCAEPAIFAKDALRLKTDMGLQILGGCCGTDNRHLDALARLLRKR